MTGLGCRKKKYMKSDLWKILQWRVLQWSGFGEREILGTMMVQSNVNFKDCWISARIRNSKSLGFWKNCYTLNMWSAACLISVP